MPFGITGFGAQQTYPAPQVFQALSLSGAPPVPPAPPYGNPNENLVPVARTGNPVFPANLTVVAHLTYQAVLNASTQLGPVKPSTAAKAPVVVPTANQIATSQISEPSSQTLLTHLRDLRADSFPKGGSLADVGLAKPAYRFNVQWGDKNTTEMVEAAKSGDHVYARRSTDPLPSELSQTALDDVEKSLGGL